MCDVHITDKLIVSALPHSIPHSLTSSLLHSHIALTHSLTHSLTQRSDTHCLTHCLNGATLVNDLSEYPGYTSAAHRAATVPLQYLIRRLG